MSRDSRQKCRHEVLGMLERSFPINLAIWGVTSEIEPSGKTQTETKMRGLQKRHLASNDERSKTETWSMGRVVESTLA